MAGQLGFAAFHPAEPCGRFDIYEVKQQWGSNIALMGNIDVAGVLSVGIPDQVEDDTLRHLRHVSSGGGHVCGSSRNILDNIPIENLQAMIQAVCRFKRTDVPR